MKSSAKYAVITALFLGAFFTYTPEAHAATTIRSAALASANTQKGARYVWGAEGGYSKGYDCSGLIYWSYRQHGKTLYRTAQAQYDHSKHIAWRDRKPGDLVFIKDRYGHVFHAGILTRITNGTTYMVNANTGSYRGYKVVEAPVYEYTYGSPYSVAGRY